MRNFGCLIWLRKKFQTSRGKLIAVAISFVVYFVTFVFLYPQLGLPIIAVGIIPLLLGAWFYGVWVGILSALALYIMSLFLVVILGWENIWVVISPGALVSLFIGVIAGLTVGRCGEVSRKNQEAFRQHMSLLEERGDHSRFLAQLSDALLAAEEVDSISSMLKVLVDRIGALFGADHCYLTFWDDKQRRVIPMAAYGSSSEAFFASVRNSSPDRLTLTVAVLDAGQIVAIEDIRFSHQFSPDVADEYSSQSLLGLPLIKGDRKLGAVILGYSTPRYFTAREIEQGEVTAHQVSAAIAKALLLEEARQRVHELVGIHKISEAFSLHGDPRRTFGQLTKTLAELMNVEKCLIGLFNPLTHRFHLQTPAFGLDDKLVASVRYSLEAQTDITEGSSFGVFRANSEAEIPAKYVQLAYSLGVNCILVVPLFDAKRRLLGAIFVANKPGGFTDNDVCLLEAFANQVTTVVQNARLLYAERSRAEQMGVLQVIAAAIAEVDNEDQLIENVTVIIGQKFYADSFGVLLLDEAAHELYLHSTYRIGKNEGLRRVPLGVGLTGAVARSGEPRRINDASVSPEHLSLCPGTRSELCVPLKTEEKLLGVVNIESAKAGVYTAEDEEFLTLIAGQLAVAIQRLRALEAKHYQTQQLEHSNYLIRSLAQASAHAAAASDPDGMLQILGNELVRLGLHCAVALFDADRQLVIFRYFSLSRRLMHAIEHLGNIRMQDYAIPISGLPQCSNSGQLSCFVEDPVSAMMSMVPDFSQRTATRLLRLIDVSKTSLVCQLPLHIDGKSVGILWLWGESLRESDLNAVSLFASQVAAGLQNASLLTEVGRLAITDDLTRIFNRRHFFEVAEERFSQAQRNNNSLSALVVDLDHFKQINDRYGHGVGDQVLYEVAHLMSTAMRENDVLGRYGGEEFSIVLPDTTADTAINVAERLLSSVSGVPVETDAGTLAVHLSIGVAGMSKETPTFRSLILRADQAMYLAKRAGRNCVAIK